MISQLGRYEIVDELGKGAMGVVYRARDPLIDRVVAIKTISLNLATDENEAEEYEARFYQEAKAAGRLSHPNIVTVYDVGRSGDVAYIAMEFLQGRELRDILDGGQRLPVRQVLDIVAQVATGMAYAHEHGIIHRDIKPSNIMVSPDDHVKITDFGIARITSSSIRTQTGMILGSPKYMSPEQVLGKQLDQRTDIFSLGVMLYEMLTGQVPFTGENINAIMYQILNAAPPPPSTLNPAAPAALDAIVARALAKRADERYQNAREFADDLRACRDALHTPAARTEAPRPPGAMPATGATMETRAKAGSPAASNPNTPPVRPGAPNEHADGAKTLKVTRPSLDAIKQAGPAKTTARTTTVQATRPATDAPASRSYTVPLLALLILLVLVSLVLKLSA